MRNAAKALARGVSLVLVLPLLAYYVTMRAFGAGVGTLEGCSQLLALVPGLPGQYLRRAFFSQTLEYCGKTAVISFGAVLSSSSSRIGEGAYIGPFCTIGLAHIEADTLIAAGAQIPSGQYSHDISPGGSVRDRPGQPRVVKVGPGAWIGNNAVVMADVGAESIVGAGAVVTRPIPPRTVAVGVPARPIRQRGEASPR